MHFADGTALSQALCSMHFSDWILLKFCTEHSSLIAVLSAKFQKDLSNRKEATNQGFCYIRIPVEGEFRIIHAVTGTWLLKVTTKKMMVCHSADHQCGLVAWLTIYSPHICGVILGGILTHFTNMHFCYICLFHMISFYLQVSNFFTPQLNHQVEE